MELEGFTASLAKPRPPKGLSLPLRALWWEAKGDWGRAHECAQQCEADAAGQWVHAYLHRKEGDAANAGYWYRRCGRVPSRLSFEREWREIAAALLGG
jgi:hypothetical protein